VLERGYAIVRDGGGRVVKNAADAPDGTELQIRLSTGELAARVTGSTAKT
jgi:exodeoxyribonuclease VII large subunit